MDTLHPSDTVMGGIVVRSPFAEVPSGSLLLQLEPRPRAVYVLAQAGEDPALVGAKLTKGPRAEARQRVFAIVQEAHMLGVQSLTALARAELRAILVDELTRWPFLLRASGAFGDITELAAVLGVHRASIYRHLDTARALIQAHVKENPSWGTTAGTAARRRSSTNRPVPGVFSAGVST